jgi:hypothetical protein
VNADDPDSSPPLPGTLTPDGRHVWDGTQWRTVGEPANQGVPRHADGQQALRVVVIAVLAFIVAFCLYSVVQFQQQQNELGDIADRAACEYSDDC